MLKVYNKIHGLVGRRGDLSAATSDIDGGGDNQVAADSSEMDTTIEELENRTATYCSSCSFEMSHGSSITVQHCQSLLCRFCIRRALQEAVDRGKFNEVRCPMQRDGVICNEIIAEDEVNAALRDEDNVPLVVADSAGAVDVNINANESAMDTSILMAASDACDVLIEFNGVEMSCLKCKIDLDKGTGIVLQRCRHVFCRTCITEAIQSGAGYQVKCPTNCVNMMMDSEIRIMVNDINKEETEVFLAGMGFIQDHPCKIGSCDGVCERLEETSSITQCLICNTLQCFDCQSSVATMNLVKSQYDKQLEALQKQLDNQIELSRILLEEMLSQNKYGEDIKQWKEDFENREERLDSPVTPTGPKPAHVILLEKLNTKDILTQGLMIVGIGVGAVFIGYSSFAFIRWAWPALEIVATRLATVGTMEMVTAFVGTATFASIVDAFQKGTPLDSEFFKTAGAEVLKLITHFAPMFLKRNPAFRA